MTEVRQVKTKAERKQFIDFPLSLYKGNEYFVPMFYSGEKQIFNPEMPYNKVCDTAFFLCYKDGKVVGRIQGIIQRPANEKWNQKRVRFTRFDAVDDDEVAAALFKAVEDWAKQKGMDEFVGPLGYSDLEREGLLIEGFDQPQTYEEQYNYPYYRRLIENYGFTKDVDWLEHKLYLPKEKNEKLLRISNMMLDRYRLKMVRCKSIKEFIDKYAEQLFALIDETYSRLYGTMPLNKEIVDSLIGDFKLIVRAKDLVVIIDEGGKIVGFAIMFPSISDAVRKSKGKITLPFLFNFIKAKRNPKVLDLGLIGVLPEYESKGIATAMIGTLIEYMEEEKIEHLETNLMLEENPHILNMLKHFDKVYNKRRRCFVKKI